MKCIYQAILTPDEGGYAVEVPDLPGCFSFGETLEEAIFMAADAMKTYVAALLADGDKLPPFVQHDCPEGSKSIDIFFETDENYIEGDFISAAQAARELKVTPARVTHMINAGLLDAHRNGRHTYVSVESVKARLKEKPKAGRPRKKAKEA